MPIGLGHRRLAGSPAYELPSARRTSCRPPGVRTAVRAFLDRRGTRAVIEPIVAAAAVGSLIWLVRQ
ncbi:hypothetical protein [Streptomyces sp. NPDC057909]|uniref:hypothetical protein n=1 Tax=Streptomyces sp. NPDC057909 TaxID=3346277 RepID=UPI0036EE44D1